MWGTHAEDSAAAAKAGRVRFPVLNQVLSYRTLCLRTLFSTVCVHRRRTTLAFGFHALLVRPAQASLAAPPCCLRARATFLCRTTFVFRIKALVLTQDASSQFCPQKVCRTSTPGTGKPCGVNDAVPAIKRSTHLNLNRIKHLSQHKRACAHSFPQKVCKDEASDKMGLPKSAIQMRDVDDAGCLI
jgi:hypothetical protein